jgi:hypothetical protein
VKFWREVVPVAVRLEVVAPPKKNRLEVVIPPMFVTC